MNGSLRASREPAGFTLLEVLVAVTILGVALVSLLGLHARNINLISRSQDLTVAGMLASGRVARLRAGPLPDIGQTSGDFSQDMAPDSTTPVTIGTDFGDRFAWTQIVEATAVPGLHVVRVIVHAKDDETPIVELAFLAGSGVIH